MVGVTEGVGEAVGAGVNVGVVGAVGVSVVARFGAAVLSIVALGSGLGEPIAAPGARVRVTTASVGVGGSAVGGVEQAKSENIRTMTRTLKEFCIRKPADEFGGAEYNKSRTESQVFDTHTVSR
jgi:hypothetical protein